MSSNYLDLMVVQLGFQDIVTSLKFFMKYHPSEASEGQLDLASPLPGSFPMVAYCYESSFVLRDSGTLAAELPCSTSSGSSRADRVMEYHPAQLLSP